MSHTILLSYAILATVRLAFWTSICGAGVVAGSADSETFSTDTLKQQHLGTVIIAVEVTLKKFSVVGGTVAASAGVTIALDVRMGSPSMARAIAIGPTVPPSGIAILPLKVT